MSKSKFANVIELIRQIFGLVSDLIPVADSVLDAVTTARRLIEEYIKATKEFELKEE